MKSKHKLRAAKFGDIPQINDMLLEGHARSRYKDFAPYNERRAKALVMNSIQRHGGSVEGSTFCAVVDNGEALEGFIIAILQPFYHVTDALEATDMFFYTRQSAHSTTARRLMRAMHKWASKCEGPYVIRQANSDMITDPKKSGPMFERSGMACVGNIYEKGHTK